MDEPVSFLLFLRMVILDATWVFDPDGHDIEVIHKKAKLIIETTLPHQRSELR